VIESIEGAASLLLPYPVLTRPERKKTKTRLPVPSRQRAKMINSTNGMMESSLQARAKYKPAEGINHPWQTVKSSCQLTRDIPSQKQKLKAHDMTKQYPPSPPLLSKPILQEEIKQTNPQ
jgi:hypothetical protein